MTKTDTRNDTFKLATFSTCVCRGVSSRWPCAPDPRRLGVYSSSRCVYALYTPPLLAGTEVRLPIGTDQ